MAVPLEKVSRVVDMPHVNGVFPSNSPSLLPEPSIGHLWQLLEIASESAGNLHIYKPGSILENLSVNQISYQDLLQTSEQKAFLICRIAGLNRDSIVLLHFDNHTQNIEWLWAVIHAGYIPAISTPFSADSSQRDAHLKHLKGLLGDPLLLTTDALVSQYPEVRCLRVHTVDGLTRQTLSKNGSSPSHTLRFQDLDRPSVLMLTSGSTGNAKAVCLTAPQIISSVCGKSEGCLTTSSSVFLNWIGLDHVANLTEIHLHAMLLGAQQVHVQANDLLANPLLFVHLLAKHRVTHTFAPNFFLALLEKSVMQSDPSDAIFSLDLSSLQNIVSGGEANVLQTAENVGRLLMRLGARGQVIRIAYGLTETSAGLIYGMLDSGYETKEKHEFASLGKPISGANMRVSRDDGTPASAYETGNLELSGPVVFKRYYNDPAATMKAFTEDGWYITGDRAYIDSSHKANMSGRAKEVIVINGVKYFPVDIEAAIEKASLPGIMPSYIAAFSHRPRDSQTETYCIVYGSIPGKDEPARTTDSISHITSRIIGTRPKWIVPLPQARLNKSSLGKLSRTKIQKQFESGVYDDAKIEVSSAMRQIALQNLIPPETTTERTIVQVLSEMLEIPDNEISVDSTIFELGITSVGLFKFEQSLRQHLQSGLSTSIITFLSNPVIRSIANAIDNQHSRQYDPVVQLQQRGTKTPLWLVHPASGNVLAFLPLARTVTDRPLFALTARGLSNNETLFSSISEMSDTYHQHVKKTQPHGPYALTGYSLGTTVAFELAKRLEANGDTVAFCAALDSPPHVSPLVQPLDWTAAAVLVSYFLELIPQDSVPTLIARFRNLSKPDTIRNLLDVSRPEQRATLNLDMEQLLAIVNVTDNFGAMAKSYRPQGQVEKVDVFYCTPLYSVEKDRESWVKGQLAQWQDFSRTGIEFHECEGDHADMLNPTYVKGFEKRLNQVLEARGI